MPHFIIECSDAVYKMHQEEVILKEIHQVANESQLFTEDDIKVRMKPFINYLVGNDKRDFIHVFAHVLQGRTEQQKASLSKAIITKLMALYPDIHNIAINISEFEKATYCNRQMLE